MIKNWFLIDGISMRLLLVEDDQMIGASVRDGLRREGYSVDWVRDGMAAELAVANGVYELILLDLGLPKMDGLALLKSLRAKKITIPVLVITARDSVADRVKGLDMGADDYLVKPVNLDELSARIRALARRQAGRASPLIEVGRIRLNPATHEVFLDASPISVSAREFAILQALLMQPGEPISRAELEEKIYGWDEEVGSNAIEVHIHSLRKKLGASSIANVRGVGYMIRNEA